MDLKIQYLEYVLFGAFFHLLLLQIQGQATQYSVGVSRPALSGL